MRYMDWNYLDLMTCPEHYIEVIVEESRREAAEARAAARSKANTRR